MRDREEANRSWRWLCVGIPAVIAGLAVSSPAASHEPVFSPGPHTIFKGGVGTSISSTFGVPSNGDTQIGLNGGLLYGVTEDLNLAVGLPVAVDRQTEQGSVTAVGDPVFQVKWRPWKNLAPKRVDALSLIGAMKIPAGHADVSLGNTGYTFGATAAREHQRYYFFSSARYTTQTVGIDGTKPGDVFQYDLVTGVRPIVFEYDHPDPVVLVELNGTTTRPPQSSEPEQGNEPTGEHSHTLRQGAADGSEFRTRRQAHSGGPAQFQGGETGGTEFAVSPELLLSWGPVMLKGGVQLPFFNTFETESATPAYRIKSDLIVQF